MIGVRVADSTQLVLSDKRWVSIEAIITMNNIQSMAQPKAWGTAQSLKPRA